MALSKLNDADSSNPNKENSDEQVFIFNPLTNDKI